MWANVALRNQPPAQDRLADVGYQNCMIGVVIRAVAVQERFQCGACGLLEKLLVAESAIGKSVVIAVHAVRHKRVDYRTVRIEHASPSSQFERSLCQQSGVLRASAHNFQAGSNSCCIFARVCRI